MSVQQAFGNLLLVVAGLLLCLVGLLYVRASRPVPASVFLVCAAAVIVLSVAINPR